MLDDMLIYVYLYVQDTYTCVCTVLVIYALQYLSQGLQTRYFYP